MDWQEIRRRHPHRWLVVEALEAHTDGAKRIIDSLEIAYVAEADWAEAWARYKAIHQANPSREYYVLHTDRSELDIGVLDIFRRSAVEP